MTTLAIRHTHFVAVNGFGFSIKQSEAHSRGPAGGNAGGVLWAGLLRDSHDADSVSGR